MFTGIVRAMGIVESLKTQGERASIRIRAGEAAEGLKVGDSVSVSGVCLTATSIRDGVVAFDAVRTTLSRTTLLGLRRGDRVNLEEALRLGDPLGGHLVSGHVDGVGTVRSVERTPAEARFAFDAPDEVLRGLVERGSVAVDGISLTVARLGGAGFEAAVIPHTLSATTLGLRKGGDRVNLEVDLIGRYVAKYLGALHGEGGITLDKLREAGF